MNLKKVTLRLLFDVFFKARLRPGIQALVKRYGMAHPLQRPLFVIGLNRSGTTILTDCLSDSTEIVGWSEANEVWDPIGFPYEAARIKRPFWPIDPQGYTDSVLGSVESTYLDAIPGIFAMYTDIYSKSQKRARFLTKSPMNTLRIELIHRLFPDACFVSLIRDPRAVVRSWTKKIIPKLEKHPFSDVEKHGAHHPIYHVDGVKYEWEEMVTALAKSYTYVVTRQIQALKELPGEQTYFTSYEELGRQLRDVLVEIDMKFGVDPDNRNWDQIPETLEDRNTKYKKQFSHHDIRLIENECGDLMGKLGYEVS